MSNTDNHKKDLADIIRNTPELPAHVRTALLSLIEQDAPMIAAIGFPHAGRDAFIVLEFGSETQRECAAQALVKGVTIFRDLRPEAKPDILDAEELI